MVRRLLMLVTAGALATSAVATGAPAQAGDPGVFALPAPVIEVRDAGDEPVAPLRYVLSVGTTMPVTQTVDQTIRQVDEEGLGSTNRIPTITLGLSVSIDEVLPDGTFRTGVAFTSVDATGDGSSQSEQQARAIESALVDLTDLTGETTITDRGVVVSGGYDIPEDLPEDMRTLLEQYESQLQSVSPPLPEEAVGVGARWRASTELDLGGIEAQQRYEYRVESVSGSQVELAVKFRQTAEPQAFSPPGAPAGARYRLLAFRARGEGTVTLDLTRPLPLDADLSVHLVQRFRVRHQGETKVFEATIDQEQTIEPA